MHWCLATIDIKRKEINYYDRSVHRKLNWSDWLVDSLTDLLTIWLSRSSG